MGGVPLLDGGGDGVGRWGDEISANGEDGENFS